MVVINNIAYEYARLQRFERIAGAMLNRCNSNFKHFAFLVRGRRILKIGFNNITKSSRLATYPLGGVHAECSVLDGLDDITECRKATLVTIRLNNHKHLRNAYPCPICMELIKRVGIKRLYYSTNTGFEFLRL